MFLVSFGIVQVGGGKMYHLRLFSSWQDVADFLLVLRPSELNAITRA